MQKNNNYQECLGGEKQLSQYQVSGHTLRLTFELRYHSRNEFELKSKNVAM